MAVGPSWQLTSSLGVIFFFSSSTFFFSCGKRRMRGVYLTIILFKVIAIIFFMNFVTIDNPIVTEKSDVTT